MVPPGIHGIHEEFTQIVSRFRFRPHLSATHLSLSKRRFRRLISRRFCYYYYFSLIASWREGVLYLLVSLLSLYAAASSGQGQKCLPSSIRGDGQEGVRNGAQVHHLLLTFFFFLEIISPPFGELCLARLQGWKSCLD